MRVHPLLLVVLLLMIAVGGATKAGYGPLVPEPTPSPWVGAPNGPLEQKYGKKQGTYVLLGVEALVRYETASIDERLDLDRLRAACAQIAGAEALPIAVTSECRAVAAFSEQLVQLDTACAGDSTADPCRAAAFALEAAAGTVVLAKRARAAALRSELAASACRTALLPPGADLAAYRESAKRANALGTAIGSGAPTTTARRARRALTSWVEGHPWTPDTATRLERTQAACPSTIASLLRLNA